MISRFGEVVRHSGICEFHNCSLCREVSHCEHRKRWHDVRYCPFSSHKEATGSEGDLLITVSQVISRFMKIDWTIYCSYSPTQKIQNGFLQCLLLLLRSTLLLNRNKHNWERLYCFVCFNCLQLFQPPTLPLFRRWMSSHNIYAFNSANIYAAATTPWASKIYASNSKQAQTLHLIARHIVFLKFVL